MENPATWGDAENVIHDAITKHHYELQAEPGLCGLSLTRRIADALRSAGLLHETGSVTRFEVINHSGKPVAVSSSPRALTAYGVRVQLALQDDGGTLKIFLSEREGNDNGS